MDLITETPVQYVTQYGQSIKSVLSFLVYRRIREWTFKGPVHQNTKILTKSILSVLSRQSQDKLLNQTQMRKGFLFPYFFWTFLSLFLTAVGREETKKQQQTNKKEGKKN